VRSTIRIFILSCLVGCGSGGEEVASLSVGDPVDCALCGTLAEGTGHLSSLTLFFQSRVDGEIEPCG
jgi:hypothetical protein